VEAVAFSTAPPPEPEAKAPPPKEVIFSETIKTSNEPVIVKVEDEGHSPAHIYVVWKLEAFICKMGDPLVFHTTDFEKGGPKGVSTNPPSTSSLWHL
jgi:hypothetical protein